MRTSAAAQPDAYGTSLRPGSADILPAQPCEPQGSFSVLRPSRDPPEDQQDARAPKPAERWRDHHPPGRSFWGFCETKPNDGCVQI